MRDLNFKDPESYASGTVRPEWIPQGGHAESASNPGWEPLGNNSNRFKAIFEGNGHTIVNLYINNTKEAYLGLIKITSPKAEIRNLGLINSTIKRRILCRRTSRMQPRQNNGKLRHRR